MESGLLLDVVVGESTAILKLLAGENQALLVGGDGLSGQGLDEDLHTTTEAEDKVKGRLLLNVVVGEGTAILKLLAGEDQALLVRRNALLVLDLGLDIVDGVGG